MKKFSVLNIFSLMVLISMPILQFLPWLNIVGESRSILYWLTNMNTYHLQCDMIYFVVIYLFIWLYSCFSIPAIIMIIVKKNKANPVFSWLTSIFAIGAYITLFVYCVTIKGPYITIIPTILLYVALINIILILFNHIKNKKNSN